MIQNTSWRESISEYCKRTSLHGWQYLGPNQSICRNLTWILIICSAFGLGGYFITISTIDFINATTTTTIATSTGPLEDITFPSIVICNVNQLKNSFLQSLNREGLNQFGKIFTDNYLTGISEEELTPEVMSHIEVIKEKVKDKYQWNESMPLQEIATQHCSDLIVLSEYQSNNRKIFHDAFKNKNDLGSCCLIEPYLDFKSKTPNNWTQTENSGYIWHTIQKGHALSGVANGLRLIIDIESYDYGSSDTSAVGIKMGAFYHLSKTHMGQYGYYIQEGTETLLGMRVTKQVTTEAAMHHLNPEERDCLANPEVQMKYTPYHHGYSYTLENCQYNAFVEKIVSNCNCLPLAILSGLDHNKSDPYISWRYKYKVSSMKVRISQLTFILDIIHLLRYVQDQS